MRKIKVFILANFALVIAGLIYSSNAIMVAY